MLTFGSLFAGIGGIDLGLERAGMRCAWQVEIDPYCRRVLAKHWPDVARFNDVRDFPPAEYHPDCGGLGVDLIAGGFPCVDISSANTRGRAGLDGDGSGLWHEFARVVWMLEPQWVFIENGPNWMDWVPEVRRSLLDADTPACRYACTPAISVYRTNGREYSFWPTPTAKANHCAPSMRKWPAYARFQDDLKLTGGAPPPTLWEEMMGFPLGWTDLEPSATPSSPK